MSTIKVLLADDHQMFLDGLKMILQADENIEIVGTASNGEEALAFLKNHEVDVLVLDINMPGMDGVETIRHIKQQNIGTKVLILSMFSTDVLIKRLLRIGAEGYVLKDNGHKHLRDAILKIAAGEKYYSQEVMEAVMDGLNPAEKKTGFGNVKLTPREMEILQLIAQEHTTPEIAEKLFISQGTVITHRKNLIRKLEVRNTAGLIKYAMQLGLIE